MKLKESVTEKIEYPNVTKEGYLIYDNTYFKNRGSAIDYGIVDSSYWIKSVTESIEDKKKDIKDQEERLASHVEKLHKLKTEKSKLVTT